MTVTINAYIDQLDTQEKRLSQCLPTLVTLFMTMCLPWVCQRSLDVWRATQVYDGQSDKHDATSTFTVEDEVKKPATAKGRVFSALRFWPFYTELFIFGTAFVDNETRWPAIAFVRKVIPFAILFGLFCFALGSWVALASPQCHKTVGRSMDPDSKKASPVLVHMFNSRPISKSAGLVFFLLLVVLPSALLTYLCYTTPYSWHVLALVAGATMSFSLLMITRSATSFKTASIRTHLKCLGLVISFIAGVVALVLVVFAAIIIFTKGVKGLSFSSLADMFGDESNAKSEKDAPGQKFDTTTDVPSVQLFAIIFTFFWSVCMPFPASLITFLYRYEQSKAGLTTVSPEEAEAALALSKDVARAYQADLTKPTHPFDTLGRTPILVDCHPVKVDRSKLKLTPKPLCTSAIISMIVIHMFVLEMLSGLSADVLVPYFPHTEQDTRSHPEGTPVVISLAPILAYPVILLVTIPLFTVISSISRGESIAANFRHLWKYEEKWGVDYKRAEPPVVAEAEQKKEVSTDGQKVGVPEGRLVDDSDMA